MSNRYLLCRNNAKKKQPRKINVRRMYKPPCFMAIARLEKAIFIIEQLKGKPTKSKVEALCNAGYPTPTDKRIRQKGGVGSYRWMPKFRCFRLQIAATHINANGYFCPYALAIDIF